MDQESGVLRAFQHAGLLVRRLEGLYSVLVLV
jgi:hypothetical protein